MSQVTLFQLEEYLLKVASTKYAHMDLGKKGGLIAANSTDRRHQQFLNKVFKIAKALNCLSNVTPLYYS